MGSTDTQNGYMRRSWNDVYASIVRCVNHPELTVRAVIHIASSSTRNPPPCGLMYLRISPLRKSFEGAQPVRPLR